MYLKRYHDLEISKSGVWRILQRLDLNLLPASQKHKTYEKRWKRYEKPQPGHAVQVDVKFITPIGGAGKRFYQFTAIDDCTRPRVLRIYPRCNQKTAIQFLDYLLAKLPFRVDVIQTDNGGGFGSQFHYHVLDRGIRHVYIKPASPRLDGKVERSHRIDEEEFYRMLDGVVIDSTQIFNDKLQEWEDFEASPSMWRTGMGRTDSSPATSPVIHLIRPRWWMASMLDSKWVHADSVAD
ncbi:MAG: DDE-type integrase/transposase/recombinase [Acidimicrobiia bacterium]|nr:DDE-type integrase/transposase/recombinase [Acidimicrobiia bacterium]